MPYPVLNDFVEENHNGLTYEKDELYPKTGFEADPERVAFLQKKHKKYNVAFLGEEVGLEEDKTEADKEPDEKTKKKAAAKKSTDK
jgi:hypothetical protein